MISTRLAGELATGMEAKAELVPLQRLSRTKRDILARAEFFLMVTLLTNPLELVKQMFLSYAIK
jgi:hypothetical protein